MLIHYSIQYGDSMYTRNMTKKGGPCVLVRMHLDRPMAPPGDSGSRSDKRAGQTWQEASNIAMVDLAI